ncbi:MAG TPA: TonB-dependent receptor [Bacteroidota bacterium]|jgi:outer membrane receptor protein involved in Fe transport
MKPLLGGILLIVSLHNPVAARGFRGTTGIVNGRVFDAERRIPLAAVNVLILSTTQGSVTDTGGYFEISNVRAGIYRVSFSLLGYTTVVIRNFTVIPDLRNTLDAELEPSPIELHEVEVEAKRPLIQKDQAATAFSIGEVKLDKLPVSTMSDVLTLQPGTTSEGNVRGGRTDEVVFLVDGLPIQDVMGGGPGATIPKGSITGMTIVSGGFEAEYGNALSGVVNVVTRSGSNTGAAALRVEKDNLLPESWSTESNRSTEGELTASGPVIHDRLFYFASNDFLLTDTRWWQDFRLFFSSPVSKEFDGFDKLEYLFSPRLRLSVQGMYSLHTWRDYEYGWRFNLAGLPPEKRNSYRLVATLSHAVGDHLFYTASLSRFYLGAHIGEDSKAGIDPEPYEYDLFLRYVIGGKRNWWADTRQIIYTLKGEITDDAIRSHLLKAGFELNGYDLNSELVKYEPQLTYFGKPVANAPLLNYSNSYRYYPRSGSVFVQDKIELARDGSNASFGFRWDFLDPTADRPVVEFVPTAPGEFMERVTGTARASFKQTLSPRVAVAAPVGPADFLFVNFGQYFQFPLFNYLYSGITPVQLREGSRNVLTGNPNLEPERTISWEIGYKRQFTEKIVGSVTYFQKSIQNQIDARTLVPFDSKFSGDFGFASYVNNAEAFARGLEFVVSRENDERLSGSVSYTYMTTEGVSEYADQRINFAQWGFPLAPVTFPLSWDQRHTLKLDVEPRLPLGIEGDLIVLYNSPRPYTYFPTRDGFNPLYPNALFVPNNARMEDVLLVNLKISRRFGGEHGRSMTFYADVRNLLNRDNVRWVDSNGKIGGELGDPAAYYEPRRIRVGAKAEF